MKQKSKLIAILLLICFLLTQTGLLAVAIEPSDLSNHWAEQVIKKAIDNGIVSGYPDGTIKPDTAITRAEFVTIVNKVYKKKDQNSTCDLSDVKTNDWFYTDVASAINSGYVTGYPDGTFGPNNYISRQEVAVALAKLIELNDNKQDVVSSFNDNSSIENWAKLSVNLVVSNKIMKGYPDGSFNPQRSITRAETLTVLDIAKSLYEKPATPATGGGGGGGGGGGQIDTIPPVVTIISPTTESNYTINTPTISISGIASDNGSVSNVVYSVYQGQTGIAVGTTSWAINNLKLKPGKNIVRITAKDEFGNKADDEITINYNIFLSSLKLSTDSIFINEETPVNFQIAIKDDSEFNESTIKVVALNSEDQVVDIVTDLRDDGNINNGDDIALDGVFSGQASFNEDSKGKLKLAVCADTPYDTIFSSATSITVLSHLTESQIDYAISFPDEIEQQYNVFKSVYGYVYSYEANQKMLEWLKTKPEVANAGAGNNNLFYVLDSGVWGAVMYESAGEKGGGSSSDDRQTPVSLKVQSLLSSDITPSIKNNKVAIVSPFATQGGKKQLQDSAEAYDKVFDIWREAQFDTTRIEDSYANVNFFKSLDQYGAVFIDSHGGVFSDNTPFFTIGEKLNKADISAGGKYEKDYLLDKIGSTTNGYLLIAPSFISEYNKSFPGSIIHMGSCDSSVTSAMGDAFIANGAKAYYGYDNSVKSTYDGAVAQTVSEALVNKGMTTGDALSHVITVNGSDDKDNTPAHYELIGDNNATLISKELVNGGFELGNLQAWNTSGDTRVLSKLGPINPQEGQYTAIISTGLGAVNDSNSILNQKMIIPSGIKKLSFSYNVVSEEPMEYVDSQYDDKFEAVFITSDEKVIMAEESVNTSTWTPIDGINFYDGDDTTFMTGWKHVEFDVSAYAGQQPIVIEFHTWDQGDSIYDTAALIDNVKLNK